MSCNRANAESPRVFVIDTDAARAARVAANLRERLECEPLMLAEPSGSISADLVVYVAVSIRGELLSELLRRIGDAAVVVVTESRDDRIATEWILAGAEDVVCEPELGCAAVRALARSRRRHAAPATLFAGTGTRLPAAGGRRTRISSLVAFLQAAALTDPLTGLANRRAMDARLERLWSDSMRDCQDLSVLMIDLDNFKQTNDRFGHAGGDAVLVALADAVRAQSRKGDLAARFGGDEVVLLLPRADAVQAHAVAERLREDFIARAGVLIPGRPDAHAPVSNSSLSIGVASRLGVEATSPMVLLARADEALYVAKRSGKGCTHVGAVPPADPRLVAV